MSDLISREEAIDAILGLTNCDTAEKLRAYVIEHDLGSWWSGGALSAVGKVERLPSAEPKTPSNGSITSMKSKKMHDRTTGDLISREDAIDAIFSEPLYESGMKKRDADAVVPAIYEKIKSLPSAEPEIIRCRDCKHHDGIRCFRWNSTIITGFDDYCSNAERRGESDE